jgi:phosphatidate cytidylyltransferase
VLVAIPAVATVLVLNWAGGLTWTLALLGMGCVCLYEFYKLNRLRLSVQVIGFMALAVLLLATHYTSQRLLVLPVGVALIVPLFAMNGSQPATQDGTQIMTTVMLSLFWIGFCLSQAILLRQLPHGELAVIDVLAGTFLGDTGAYLGGRAFGRHKLAPRISPNKTIEGLLVGMVVAITAVYLLSLFESWITTGQALLLGLGVAVVAPIGDLFESSVKRKLGAKDSGRFFGAHGGALDRIDAALFAAVAGYYIWQACV